MRSSDGECSVDLQRGLASFQVLVSWNAPVKRNCTTLHDPSSAGLLAGASPRARGPGLAPVSLGKKLLAPQWAPEGVSKHPAR
mmetsp:Transcript_3173/g.9261  ORF Transcript_3173/g.9261 Transcript_3173/m.9261 type:complete len:83 (+) Transcript_3173:48-296(+)